MSRTRAILLALLAVVAAASAALHVLAPEPEEEAPWPASRGYEVDDVSGPFRTEPLLDFGEAMTSITHAGDGSGRLFVTSREGIVYIVRPDLGVEQTPSVFLDIAERVLSGGELGLLSVAFAPDYATSGRFYVAYTRGRGAGESVLSRFRVSAADPDQADAASEEVLLVVEQPYRNHNGGQLQFGPDGYLWYGLGDGGGSGDPDENADDMTTLLGKMLRIDVSAEVGYGIPADNPFAGVGTGEGDGAGSGSGAGSGAGASGGTPAEIWAWGLRNPWRFSFDRVTGALYVADVGQNAFEEVNYVAAGTPGGLDFGWDRLEGRACYEPAEGCDARGTVAPVVVYSHANGCSVTGGYVYRGSALRELQGTYVYADFCSGLMWGLRRGSQRWESARLLTTGAAVTAFGEDEAGELYLLDYAGPMLRLVPDSDWMSGARTLVWEPAR